MNCRLPQTCKRHQIAHKIEEIFELSAEARQARWGNRKK
jgi:hypothetical protein